MLDLSLFPKAAGIGVAIAAPVGPMSVLCMRRTLTNGWRRGLTTGLGVALGDASYAVVAALGLAGLSHLVLAHAKPLHAAAGLVLIYLGLKAFWVRRDADTDSAAPSAGWRRDLATSYLLTLTNPPTIVMFAAVFTALSPAGTLDPADAAITVAGVFCGSLAWWGLLVPLVASFRHAIGPKVRRWIDRIAGAALAAFGLAELRRAA